MKITLCSTVPIDIDQICPANANFYDKEGGQNESRAP
jgi:hypothetical protein